MYIYQTLPQLSYTVYPFSLPILPQFETPARAKKEELFVLSVGVPKAELGEAFGGVREPLGPDFLRLIVLQPAASHLVCILTCSDK